MRILHVTPSFYPAHLYGGPVTSLYRLALAQVARGHDVRVLTSDANGPGKRLAGLSGRWVSEYGVETWYGRATARQDFSIEVLQRLPYLCRWAEIVHLTAVFSPTSMATQLVTLVQRNRLVVSPRGSLLPWAIQQGGPRKKWVLSALRPLLSRVAGWHATSEEEAEALRRLFPGQVPVSVIENGVDLPTVEADDKPGSVVARFVAKGEGPVVTVLGRLDPVKGIDLAIEALAQLRKKEKGAVLLLAGPDRDGHGAHFAEYARSLGVGDAVRFTGLVVAEDKDALLRDTSVLWLCSRMESFGNVVLEALRMGTPVVAVHTTPWAWLTQGQVGHHVAPEPQTIAQATLDLLSTKRTESERQRIQEVVIARFSWDAVAEKMDQLYKEAT